MPDSAGFAFHLRENRLCIIGDCNENDGLAKNPSFIKKLSTIRGNGYFSKAKPI